MNIYVYSRIVNVMEIINVYGMKGYTHHKEVVYVPADSEEEANKKIEPFNYKKHFRFTLECVLEDKKIKKDMLEKVIDLGLTDE